MSLTNDGMLSLPNEGGARVASGGTCTGTRGEAAGTAEGAAEGAAKGAAKGAA